MHVCACVYTGPHLWTCEYIHALVYSAHGGRRGLQLALSWNYGQLQAKLPDVDAENRIWVLCQSSKCSYLLSHLFSLQSVELKDIRVTA